MDITGQPLFSLKGWDKKAQGIAWVGERTKGPSPERAEQTFRWHVVPPFQGSHPDNVSSPRALPWAVLFRPFGAFEAGMDSWLVCYDISNPKRLRKVARRAKITAYGGNIRFFCGG